MAQVEEAAQGLEARSATGWIARRRKPPPSPIWTTSRLPDREAIETKLQRLTRERDNMGPVNLRAETEATEVEQQIAGLQIGARPIWSTPSPACAAASPA